MVDLSAYTGSLLWLGILLLMVMVQWVIASGAKAKRPGAIPGVIPAELGHGDFVFRAWRTHQNTVENLGTILGGAVLAILAGASPVWVNVLLTIIVLGRLLHMILYYSIATEKNPSPRSWFFILAWLANLALIILGIVAVIK
ncbi:MULTISPECIES: MAPEG family protein [Gammaproteobacteria]|uniref:MAPEG family protein n=1 Tax=Gammaproteobacteria TaxID=1236 RepID=UPI000DD03D08|nr:MULTISPECIES: MAPEG family protein [Gammaproteobacteria]RTE85949.1 MAPEG family protein [Aliidiomarina sp. B3213]TCZ90052.1 MAPEG family protein [Lysobacter sp. N42]